MLVLAGLVAFSPVLHVAIEHGGCGPAHTHGCGNPTISPGRLARGGNQRIVSTHRPFTLPRIPVRAFLQVLSRLAEPSTDSAATGSDPAPSPGAHDHHSLPQTLASGGLEQSLEIVLRELGFAGYGFLLPASALVRPARIFDTQTAGRAPPLHWS